MSILGAIVESFLGPLGKKAAQWIPAKEDLMRRKIKDYETKIKKLETQEWTPAIGVERDRLNDLLRTEKENLDRYLATNK